MNDAESGQNQSSGQDRPLTSETVGNPKNSQVLSRPIILGDLTLGSPTTFTTIGANGAATALTANPVGYLVINIGNASYQVPYYTIA